MNVITHESQLIYIYIYRIYIILNIYRRKRSCALKHTHYVGKSQKESLQECNCKQPCTNLALYTQRLTDSCCIRLLKACESDVVLHEVVLEAIVLSVLRPIAVGEVLRRLVSRICCAAVKSKLPDIFLPYGQVGVGIRGGLEAAVHSLSSFIGAHGDDPTNSLLPQT